MLIQAVFCVPVTTRAYVPSPTAPGSGETVTEMRLAVDLLTVCYEGSHGTQGPLRPLSAARTASCASRSVVLIAWLSAFAGQSVGPIWILLLLVVVALPVSMFFLLRRSFGPGSTAEQREERLNWYAIRPHLSQSSLASSCPLSLQPLLLVEHRACCTDLSFTCIVLRPCLARISSPLALLCYCLPLRLGTAICSASCVRSAGTTAWDPSSPRSSSPSK
jgi:hypothetical protein